MKYFILIISTILLFYQSSPGQTAHVNVKATSPVTPAMGVPIPEMKFISDVSAYIEQLLNTPLPKDYKVPDYVKSGISYAEAVTQCGKRYPEFYELEGEDLVRAVWVYPLRYQEFMCEAAAVREHFYPGSWTRKK